MPNLAAAKLQGASPRAQLMKRVSPELRAFRFTQKKEQKVAADILQDACDRLIATEATRLCATGSRRLSVKHAASEYWALVHKGDHPNPSLQPP